MSWSIQKTLGEPQRVLAAVEPLFDSSAKAYAGKPEEQDVLAAKAAVQSWLGEVPEGYAAVVEASGSRGTNWLSIKVECSAIRLAP